MHECPSDDESGEEGLFSLVLEFFTKSAERKRRNVAERKKNLIPKNRGRNSNTKEEGGDSTV